jgi:alkanesulfonate monooxygenase SsuD/methylene tetrahydromethanopterin reductase-like flavin-dependent oxidoreductase (luciferase family)
MRLSFKVWPQDVEWDELRDFWTEADSIPAYRTGWIYDHFVPQTGWRNHDALKDERGPCYEAWTTLSCLAAVTSRVRLGTLVSSITHRQPAVFAKMITCLDHISGGRIEVGMGAGWNEEEHRQFGIPYPPLRERFDQLEEYLDVLGALLVEHESVDYSGRFYRLDGAFCVPGAAQRPRPPITVGGKGPKRALPIVARWADHWNYPGGSLEEFVTARDRVAELREEAGGSIEDIDVSVQYKFDDLDRFARTTHEYAAAGARHVIVRFLPPLDPALLAAVAERTMAEFELEVSAP